MSDTATIEAPAATAAPATEQPAAAPAAPPAAAGTLLDTAGAPAADKLAEGQEAAAPGAEADKDKPAEAAKPEGAPEAYADFAVPEGVALDPELTGELKTLAKELNLPQAKAQQLADLGVKLAQRSGGQIAETLQRANAEWTAASQADKEFGGDKLTENLGVIAKARDTFASPELRTMLTASGLGNHPEVLRMFYRVGRAIGEDSRLVTGGTAREAAPPEHNFYPSMRQGA